jgi:hypothetical protein
MLQILPGTYAVRKISFGPLSSFLLTFPPFPCRAGLDPPALLVQKVLPPCSFHLSYPLFYLAASSHLLLRLYGMHPSPRVVSGMARAGTPAYHLCFTILPSLGDGAGLRLDIGVGPCVGSPLPSCLKGGRLVLHRPCVHSGGY